MQSEQVEGNEPQEEVTEVHKLAMSLIFDVDDTPAVLTTTDRLAVDDHVTLGADNSEGDHALWRYRLEENSNVAMKHNGHGWYRSEPTLLHHFRRYRKDTGECCGG
jgi:hypothetical protein